VERAGGEPELVEPPATNCRRALADRARGLSIDASGVDRTAATGSAALRSRSVRG
jgi:hypothetical protein